MTLIFSGSTYLSFFTDLLFCILICLNALTFAYLLTLVEQTGHLYEYKCNKSLERKKITSLPNKCCNILFIFYVFQYFFVSAVLFHFTSRKFFFFFFEVESWSVWKSLHIFCPSFFFLILHLRIILNFLIFRKK